MAPVWPEVLDENSADRIAETLIGRRVVSATLGDSDFAGRLTLDDGTVIDVAPNIGGCCCSAGDYDLKQLAAVENIITAARVAREDDSEWGPTRYRIYVIADAVEINLLTVEGNDGNGFYGTGFQLVVKHHPPPGW